MPRTSEARSDAVVVARADPGRPEILALLAESNHLVDVATLKQPGVAFFAARQDGRVLGIGAIVERREVDGTPYCEIKRMYVAPAARGLGLGRRLMQMLEAHAAELVLCCIRLETGVKQPEAIGLYRAFGYSEIGPFGAYSADPVSVFMEKRLNGT